MPAAYLSIVALLPQELLTLYHEIALSLIIPKCAIYPLQSGTYQQIADVAIVENPPAINAS